MLLKQPILLSLCSPGYCQAQGAIAVLLKYIAMLHEHATQVLPLASHISSFSSKHFSLVAKVIQEGPTGALLPELAVGLVLLQLRMPLQMVESNCVPLVGELVDHLDRLVSWRGNSVVGMENLQWQYLPGQIPVLQYHLVPSIQSYGHS